mgnify:CR=1 FL=1
MIINGDGRDISLLKEESIDRMDAFVALTENSETNIMASLVAKNQGVKKSIALVENVAYIHLSQSIGIDTLINKKLIAASFIFRYIRKGEVLNIAGIHGVDAEILEFELGEKSRIVERPLRASLCNAVKLQGHFQSHWDSPVNQWRVHADLSAF